jgi:tRNA nucleotidyltransferase (CCA-adding enzyme)
MRPLDQTVLERDVLLKGVWEGLGTPTCSVTGGYVRDRLLGRETFDLDLVLPGDLETVRGPARRLAGRLDAKAHVLGRDERRVWRIESPGLKVELWPLGELSLNADIQRRDFTVNALMWPLPSGPLDDRVGGAADLESGVLRALSRRNLEDDPVRLVRAARFLAQLNGFELEPRSRQWVRDLAPQVATAPRERIGQELSKLVTAAAAVRGFEALLGLDLLEPSAPDPKGCDRRWMKANLEAAARMRAAAHPQRAALAAAGEAAPLALLLRAWGSPQPDTVASYAWPRTLRRHAARAAQMLEDALAVVDAPTRDRRLFIHRAGASFPTVLALAAAVEPGRTWARWWRLWLARGPELVEPEPFLSGQEIAALLRIAPGPDLGRAVDALTDAQVRGEVRTKRGAERWLRRFAGETLRP